MRRFFAPTDSVGNIPYETEKVLNVMADNDYWSEVDRQNSDLSDQDKRELKLLLTVLHGKRQSRARLITRMKWFSIAIGIIVAMESTWDWVTKLFRH